ncbi:MAG: putative ABC transporter permease [Clostridia bacterium]|nr:putative ABC transporter permease [Clostridia bacterium]MBR3954365.1 putative ABC transporter permease [Clostridia bacterium]
MLTACNYIFMFFVYSACGWFGESLYRTGGAFLRKGGDKRIINSGFLYGPICPIYGAGALAFTIALVNTGLATPDVAGFLRVFFIGMILADIVEYVTSYIMEKLFNARWWDYSNNFLNLHGRICFKHSIIWGFASLLFVYGINPLYEYIRSFIPDESLVIITVIILILFFFDLVMTVIATIGVRKFIVKFNDFKNTVNVIGNLIKDSTGGMAEDMKDSVNAQFGKQINALAEQFADVRNQFNNLLGGKSEDNEKVRGSKMFRKAGTLPKRIGTYLDEADEGFKKYGVTVPENSKKEEPTDLQEQREEKK